MKALEQFDALRSEIQLFVSPTLSLQVRDPKSSSDAVLVAKELKAYLGAVEKKRKELVGPLNDQVKAINDYAKQITSPLTEADQHVRTQLNQYATEQERIRQAEQERLHRERERVERLAREERERAEEALRVQQEAEAQAHVEAARALGISDEDVQETNAALDDKLTQEWAQKQATLDREEHERQMEVRRKLNEASRPAISNARETWFCEATDLSLVPREFLSITLNEKAVLSAAKKGELIPGVRTWTEMRVAIGENTRTKRTAGTLTQMKEGET